MASPHSEHPIDAEITRLLREPDGESGFRDRDRVVAFVASAVRGFLRLPIELQNQVGVCVINVAWLDDGQAERLAGVFDSHGETHSAVGPSAIGRNYDENLAALRETYPAEPIDLSSPESMAATGRIVDLTEAAVGVVMADEGQWIRDETAHYAGIVVLGIRAEYNRPV